jgi:hypothetical protein
MPLAGMPVDLVPLAELAWLITAAIAAQERGAEAVERAGRARIRARPVCATSRS